MNQLKNNEKLIKLRPRMYSSPKDNCYIDKTKKRTKRGLKKQENKIEDKKKLPRITKSILKPNKV